MNRGSAGAGKGKQMDWKPLVKEISNLDRTVIPHSRLEEDGMVFSAEAPEGEPLELILYDRDSGEEKAIVPFPDKPCIGDIRVLKVSGIPAEKVSYNFKCGKEILQDPWAQRIYGAEVYGEKRSGKIRCGFLTDSFEWGEAIPREGIPFRDSVFYEMNVRGFTKGRRSGVRQKGTFEGIIEKIPYLKSLGITAIVLMPCYEFDETEAFRRVRVGAPEGSQDEQRVIVPETIQQPLKSESVNLWGFGPGFLLTPKASYSASGDPYQSFCEMVRALHHAGLEVLMEMDFSGSVTAEMMLSALVWWRSVYHVDGFFLFGDQKCLDAVCRNPALTGCKLISEYFSAPDMYPDGRKTTFRNLAECNRGFQNDARRFLKGDEGSLQPFLGRARYNPKDTAVVNEITTHDGFTLMDLVSYNDQHNGAREGQGASQYSWNCGAEGPTRRKEVLKLRLQQIRNALAMLFLSQGTPMILAGDEMGNTQKGNSNAWCFDSELSWVDWSSSSMSNAILEYMQTLVRFRKSHSLLHQERELSNCAMGDYFPQYSCHGENAWFAPQTAQDRSVGLMYSMKGEACLYVAYNFHWEEKKLALPDLPGKRAWKVVLSTSDQKNKVGRTISVPARSVVVLEG
jgi:isoamylase